MRNHRLIAFVLVLATALPIAAQEEVEPAKRKTETAPTSAEIAVALQAAARELLRRQEIYRPDPPLGQLDDEELPKWQAKERARLHELFGADEASEWPYEGVHRVRRQIPVGYRVGGTSLCALALLADPKCAEDQELQAAVTKALEFVLDQVETSQDIAAGPQQGYDVRSWAHCYGLNFLIEAQAQGFYNEKAQAARLVAGIKSLLKCLEVNQARGGGWNYTGGPSSSFMTGSILLVLYRAEDLGHTVKPAMLRAALKALAAGRRKNSAFAYAGVARSNIETEASGARSAVAELALYLAGQTTVAGLRQAVEAFFTSFDELLIRKSQQGTHEGPYNIAPYYFYYGHLFAARAIEALPAAERPALRERLATKIWATRDADGFWNDRIFPRSKSYATAMVMLALRAEALGLPKNRKD